MNDEKRDDLGDILPQLRHATQALVQESFNQVAHGKELAQLNERLSNLVAIVARLETIVRGNGDPEKSLMFQVADTRRQMVDTHRQVTDMAADIHTRREGISKIQIALIVAMTSLLTTFGQPLLRYWLGNAS